MKCIEELVSLEMLIDFTSVKVTVVSFLLKVSAAGASVVSPAGGGNALFLPSSLSVGPSGGQRTLPGARGSSETAGPRLHLQHPSVVH